MTCNEVASLRHTDGQMSTSNRSESPFRIGGVATSCGTAGRPPRCALWLPIARSTQWWSVAFLRRIFPVWGCLWEARPAQADGADEVGSWRGPLRALCPTSSLEARRGFLILSHLIVFKRGSTYFGWTLGSAVLPEKRLRTARPKEP